MIYDLKSNIDSKKFDTRVKFLKEKGAKVELTSKRANRSYKQNAYLHLILAWYGIETGYTLDEVKQDIFKREICDKFFKIKKNNRYVYRSTSELNTLEMTQAIDNFRNHASNDLGIYLPSPNETEILNSLEYQIKQYGNIEYL